MLKWFHCNELQKSSIITWAFQTNRRKFSVALRSPTWSDSAGTSLLSYFLSLNYKLLTRAVKVVELHTYWVDVLWRTRSWRTVPAHLSSRAFISFSTVWPLTPALRPFLLAFRNLWFSIFDWIFIFFFRVILRIFSFGNKILFRAASASTVATSSS